MTSDTTTADQSLTAPYVLKYAYKRSLGPVLSHFFTELKARRIVGIRGSDGRVFVPPKQYDPNTAAVLDEYVTVGNTGVVTSWSWVSEPRDKHPLNHPFAWALIQLDGADTGMLHAVDAGDEAAMTTGMRVQARWAESTCGYITDILCFEPEGRHE